jgi:hypothetical protein
MATRSTRNSRRFDDIWGVSQSIPVGQSESAQLRIGATVGEAQSYRSQARAHHDGMSLAPPLSRSMARMSIATGLGSAASIVRHVHSCQRANSVYHNHPRSTYLLTRCARGTTSGTGSAARERPRNGGAEFAGAGWLRACGRACQRKNEDRDSCSSSGRTIRRRQS